MDEVGYSFPSGHSTQAITFWTVVPVLVGADRSARVQRSLHALGAILVVLTAGSRIYLGVHWTFDVLGGLSLGGFWTCCVLALRGSNER
jgi:undecaprenyl-diphosphatase